MPPKAKHEAKTKAKAKETHKLCNEAKDEKSERDRASSAGYGEKRDEEVLREREIEIDRNWDGLGMQRKERWRAPDGEGEGARGQQVVARQTRALQHLLLLLLSLMLLVLLLLLLKHFVLLFHFQLFFTYLCHVS